MITYNAQSTKEILTLVGDIYEASYKPSYWEIALERLCKLVQAKSAGLFIKDYRLKSTFAMHSYGIAKSVNFAYNHGMGKLDPSFGIMSSKPIGIEPDMINLDTANYLHPIFQQLILKPAGIHYAAGVTILNDKQWYVGLGLHRSKQALAFDYETLEFINDLIPHFQRSVRIQREFTRLCIRNQAMESSLSQLALGIIITNEFGQPKYINPVAKSLLEYHPAICLLGSQINAFGDKQNAALHRAIQDISRSHSRYAGKINHAFGLYHPETDTSLPIMIAPLSNSDYEEYIPDTDACVLISLADPDTNTRLSTHSLQEAYELTEAEAIVAIELANGLTLERISQYNEVSIETVRSQLKSIFQKTGVNRQTDLVRLLLSGPFNMNN